ncbi:hypothetical protein [Streptomyces sp. R35]|uniref:Uncharacterized protein n=1 Tax=Streptomyces sp. R35 TaxID=3238630 RepID=A0AB39SLK0_9ACTN
MVAVALPVAAQGASAADSPPAGAQGIASLSRTVTLITRDKVVVERTADGRQTATVRPAAGHGTKRFSTREVDGRIHVLPLSAVPYVSSGQLDAGLFDVTGLIEQGYDDAHTKRLPLIVQYRAAEQSVSAQQAPEHSSREAVLDSVHGAAVTTKKTEAARFWDSVSDSGAPAAQDATDAPGLGQGLEKIWLDGRVRAVRGWRA